MGQSGDTPPGCARRAVLRRAAQARVVAGPRTVSRSRSLRQSRLRPRPLRLHWRPPTPQTARSKLFIAVFVLVVGEAIRCDFSGMAFIGSARLLLLVREIGHVAWTRRIVQSHGSTFVFEKRAKRGTFPERDAKDVRRHGPDGVEMFLPGQADRLKAWRIPEAQRAVLRDEDDALASGNGFALARIVEPDCQAALLE